jgi:integrase
MPKKLPPFVSRERSRHGKIVYYFRRDRGPRTRLPDLYDDKFDETYMAVLKGDPGDSKPKGRADTKSLEWLIDRYRESSSYTSLSQATQKQRRNIFRGIIESAGDKPYAAITKATISQGVERRASTPAQAVCFRKAMSGLFKWAIDAGFVEDDPTVGVKEPKAPKGDGFPAWMDEDVERYQKFWPLGTKERVWLDVLLYTGLRRGDAVILGRQHVKDGIATIRTEKTSTEVSIPIRPVLQATLDAGPTGDLHFIVGSRGEPLTKESFGNQFRDACREAGVEKSAHGLRKIAATKAAEAGATVMELEAMFGWTGGKMALHYAKSANRRRLAMSGWGRGG